MYRKKLSAAILIMAISAILAGCGNSTSGVETVTVEQTQALAKQEATTQKTTVATTTEAATQATTEAETQAETESQTEAQTEAVQEVAEAAVEAVTEAAQEIATQAATEAPTEAATQATQATTKATTSASKTYAGEFNKEVAQQVWAKVNAERSAKGLNQLAWDEDTYNFACQRALAIVKNYSHDGCGEYGENIQQYSGYGAPSASRIHQNWHNSSAHYNNYMSDIYTKGACAVYYLNGTVYSVENFVASWND